MSSLIIEWRHLDEKGETCNRCYDTGENLYNEIERLKKQLALENISVEYIETKLDATQIEQSNLILFNGIPIEALLDIKVSENCCASCSSLIGKDAYCRTVIYNGSEYEEIPTKAIRQAAYKAIGKYIDTKENLVNLGCNCGKSGCC
jgi:hypothetical protein